MLITYIRSSSYTNYDFCQMQYYINYVLGHPRVSGKKAQLGTIVHKVMECIAIGKKCLQDGEKSFDDEYFGLIKVNNKLLSSEDFINELVDKSFHHYTENCTHKYTKGDYNNCKKWVWMALNYNDGQFDPRKINIVQAEQQFDITIDEPWAKYSYELPDGSTATGRLGVKGTVDLVTEASEGVLEVVDWKTGRRLDWASGQEKDFNKLCKDPQLMLYYYALSKLYPDVKQIIMSIFFIKDGGPYSICFDESDSKKFEKLLQKRFTEVQVNQNPKMISTEQSNWKCTKICDYFKNNWEGTDTNICRYVKQKIEKDGMKKTTEDCTRDGFSVGYYEAPG